MPLFCVRVSLPIFIILGPLIIVFGILTIVFFIVSATSKNNFKSCKSNCDKGECSAECDKMISDWREHKDSIFYIDAEEVSTLWYVLSVIFGIITVILFMPVAAMGGG